MKEWFFQNFYAFDEVMEVVVGQLSFLLVVTGILLLLAYRTEQRISKASLYDRMLKTPPMLRDALDHRVEDGELSPGDADEIYEAMTTDATTPPSRVLNAVTWLLLEVIVAVFVLGGVSLISPHEEVWLLWAVGLCGLVVLVVALLTDLRCARIVKEKFSEA